MFIAYLKKDESLLSVKVLQENFLIYFFCIHRENKMIHNKNKKIHEPLRLLDFKANLGENSDS